MSGPEKYMGVAWTCLQQHIEMDGIDVANLYLGCKHSYSNLTSKGELVKLAIYDMKDDLIFPIDLYQKVGVAATGKAATLRIVATPPIEEDQARAIAKGNGGQRTWHRMRMVRAHLP